LKPVFLFFKEIWRGQGPYSDLLKRRKGTLKVRSKNQSLRDKKKETKKIKDRQLPIPDFASMR
jgi:hypothetical protein